MFTHDAPEDSTDENESAVARRGFIKVGAGAIASAVTVPAVSGVAAAHFPAGLEVDVKPDSDENAINPRSEGVVPVAVLQTDAFDPTSENVNYRFGAKDVVADGDGARPRHGGHVEDVDDDGRHDLVLHFPVDGTGFDGDEEEGLLHWERDHRDAHHGRSGSDDVRIVGNAR
ncbi:hypothetical protein [Haloparvum sp. PAK95]|uniref:hypothetical protein n=1 Tax=Haloparvum sp. PAK95 TaxID=3418962 RepID=UPI003D2F0780